MIEKMRKALDAAVEAIGGQPREGQIAMAEAVANALSDRHHLLVQAGTGTGKSLAYLVPALVHGKKVLVATATLALQRQLVERDLPRIKGALEKELGRELTFAVYKGVGNYLCLQKMNSAEADPDGEVLLEIGTLEKDAKLLQKRGDCNRFDKMCDILVELGVDVKTREMSRRTQDHIVRTPPCQL